MKRHIAIMMVAAISAIAGAVQFQNIGLGSNIDLALLTDMGDYVSIDTNSSVMVFKNPNVPMSEISQSEIANVRGIVFNGLDGEIQFKTSTNEEWQAYFGIQRIVRGNPTLLSNVYVNGKSLDEIIHTYGGNPIYGKKIAVLGDSEISGAYECDNTTTYPNYIVQRNNMTMFLTSFPKVAMPSYLNKNPTNGLSRPALVTGFRNSIPGDADIIWIHNGWNDSFDSSTPDDEFLSAEEAAMTDEQCRQRNMTDPTWKRDYKRSFNTFMQSLTNEYPKAIIAVSLPYNFHGGMAAMVNFLKKRCKVYGVECVEGSAECGFTLDDTQYFTIKSDGTTRDNVHLSRYGSERISWTFENFMKTRM